MAFDVSRGAFDDADIAVFFVDSVAGFAVDGGVRFEFDRGGSGASSSLTIVDRRDSLILFRRGSLRCVRVGPPPGVPPGGAGSPPGAQGALWH